MKTWTAVLREEPEDEEDRNPAYRGDPQDWEFELILTDMGTDVTEEVIYVTFTGTMDDKDEVIPTPEDEVTARIDAMLAGLNGAQNA